MSDTAIILDPSVAGNENGNTSNQEDATWTTTFPYGIISGIASCNDIFGTGYGKPYSGNQNNITAGYQDGQSNCWCRMTSPVRSAWVFNYTYGLASECTSRCAYSCGNYVRVYADFRTGMFTSAGN